MAADTPITVGPFTIGRWIRDCSSLKSKVELREKRPHFSLNLGVASPIASLIEALPLVGSALGPS